MDSTASVRRLVKIDYVARGDQQLANNEYHKALQAYDKALERDSKNVKAWTQKGHVFFLQGQDDLALKCWNTAIALDPIMEIACKYHKGRALIARGQYDKAIRYYDDELTSGDKLALCDPLKALAFAHQGEFDLAIQYADKCIMFHETLYSYKGILLFCSGKVQESKKCFEQALKDDPNHVLAKLVKGVYEYSENHLEQASQLFKEAEALLNNNQSDTWVWTLREYWFFRGLLFASMKLYPKAKKAFEKVLSIDPNDAPAQTQLVAIREHTASMASSELSDKEETDPLQRGLALAMEGNHVEALAYYDKALQLNPNDLRAWSYKGISYVCCQNDKEAYKKAYLCFKNVLDKDRSECFALLGFGVQRASMKEIERAARLLKQAQHIIDSETDTNTKIIFSCLRGQLFFAIQGYSQAKRSFEKVLSLDTNNRLARTQLAKIQELTASKNSSKLPDRDFSAETAESDPEDERVSTTVPIREPNTTRGEVIEDPDKSEAFVEYMKSWVEQERAARNRAPTPSPDEDRKAVADKGRALVALGKYDEAITCYDSMLAKEPHFYILALKGLVFAMRAQHYQALEYYDESVRINAKDPRTMSYKGMAHFCNGQIRESLQCFKEALKQDSEYCLALLGLGVNLYSKGNTRKASEFFKRAEAHLESENDDHLKVEFWLFNGQLFAEVKKYDKAKVAFENVQLIDPTNVPAETHLRVLQNVLEVNVVQEPSAPASALLRREAAVITPVTVRRTRQETPQVSQEPAVTSLPLHRTEAAVTTPVAVRQTRQMTPQVVQEPAAVSSSPSLKTKVAVTTPVAVLQTRRKPPQEVQMPETKESSPESLESDTPALPAFVDRASFESMLIPGRLERGEEIGVGSYGVVWKSKWHITDIYDQIVVVKRAKKKEMTEQTWSEFKREVLIQSRLKNEYVVRLFGITNELDLVMEYMARGSLWDLLEMTPRDQLSCVTRLHMALCMSKGLAYLHSQKPVVLHRDLKSLNIFVNEAGDAKLGDFGISAVITLNGDHQDIRKTIRQNKGPKGSIPWMAQELFEGNAECTPATDIFSLAVVFWELFSQILPWLTMKKTQEIIALVRKGGREKYDERTPDTPEEMVALTQRCWDADPLKRPPADVVVDELTEIYRKYNPKQTLFQPRRPTSPAPVKHGSRSSTIVKLTGTPKTPAPSPTTAKRNPHVLTDGYLGNTRTLSGTEISDVPVVYKTKRLPDVPPKKTQESQEPEFTAEKKNF